ncbi:MAG: transporter substrate-binding domain-containing protein [Lachnospiraceae bacterium]|nr:transporter substrate-binding domain-containing protein [Lachnospiraceae bacterium]
MCAKKKILLFLCLVIAFTAAMPYAAYAQVTDQKVVRVGWYDSSFCYWDEFGRRCGVDYEYQQKISAYTGWTFEYVEDSWSNLFQMLKNGEIDLLSDVSYKPERTEFMSFPDLPMGSEAYYIYIDAENREITGEDLTSFNGKKIAVNAGSIQEGFLTDWAERNNLTIDIIPLDVEESESVAMLLRGDIDGYTTVYSFGSEQKIIPISRVGASDYYYAVNKDRQDLLDELNMALSGIQDEDPDFKHRITQESNYSTNTSIFLTPAQEDWLKEHGTIRVGYRDGFLPFCDTDDKTGELIGALKDYLTHAANNLRGYNVRFETIPFVSTEAALNAMKSGEIDCVFPVNLSSYDSASADVWVTSPAMKTEMNAVMRTSNQQSLSRDSTITFAVNTDDLNIETFIMDKYPASSRKKYNDVQSCFGAVASGDADSILVSNYRMSAAEETMTKYRLFSVPTGETMPLSFAVSRANRDLYFILNKTAVMTHSDDMDSALASYMLSNRKVSFTRFLKDNWLGVVAALIVVFSVIIVLLLQKLKAERTAHEQKRLLEEAEKIKELKQTITSLLDNMPGMNFTKDAKTGVYLACNQDFAEFAHRENPDAVIGHTADEIFDSKSAAKFDEEDKIALSMDMPYIFVEDSMDADGNMRQLQTTKLKYTDVSGRQCVLGICQDMTDMGRIRREIATSKEAYEKARSTGIIYTHIAQTLARSYSDLFYVNLYTEEFIEYRTDDEHDALTEARRGWHFFEECQNDVNEYVHPDDRAKMSKALERHTLLKALERNNTFITTYRLLSDNEPTNVSMKVSRMEDDERFIIIGITNIDEEVKQRREVERVKEEQLAYARLRALAGDFLCIYSVIPSNDHYREYSATVSVEGFERPREGTDFFADSRKQARLKLYKEDVNRFINVFTKENVMAEIERHGIFSLSYRLMMDGKPRYVQLRAALVEEKEGTRLTVGISDIDANVRQEEEYERRLAQAQREANIDALTGVKNRHAYLETEERLDNQIAENRGSSFAIVIFDVNDLKKVNDTAGHKAGDQYLRDATNIICRIFKRSPIFRVGGDEFTAIVQGPDYECIEELLGKMKDHNVKALRTGGIVIACGMAKYEDDAKVATVFERADHNMYENKSNLKEGRIS